MGVKHQVGCGTGNTNVNEVSEWSSKLLDTDNTSCAHVPTLNYHFFDISFNISKVVQHFDLIFTGINLNDSLDITIYTKVDIPNNDCINYRECIPTEHLNEHFAARCECKDGCQDVSIQIDWVTGLHKHIEICEIFLRVIPLMDQS